MKKIALLIGLLFATPAFAADNAVIVTPGVGVTMKSKDIGAGVQAMQPILSDASGNALLTTLGADAVSNTLTGIPVYSRQLFYNGTTWDRWQGAVTLTSGTLTTVSTVTNLSQMGGAAIAMGTGARSAGTQRVTVATDDLVPISVASLPLPSGAATAANQTTANTSLATIATNSGSPVPACSASPCTTVIGAVVGYQGTTALSVTNGWYTNLLQGNAVISATNGLFTNLLVGNAAVATGTGAQGATSPRFTVATDSATVAGSSSIPAGTNSIGSMVAATPATPIAAAASDNHAVLKNGAGVAMSVHTSNNSATKNYLRLYDAGTGFNGCNSATGVIFAMEIPPSDSGFSVSLGGGVGIAFTNGLSWCITSGFGLTDTTNATASAIYANASYR